MTSPRDRPAPAIGSASLPCENCGRTTPHRILRLDPRADGSGGVVRGVARCQDCRYTHPFETGPPEEIERTLIVSRGASSERSALRLRRSAHLQVGADLPGQDPPLRIRRLERSDGSDASEAAASEVRTVWAVRDEGAVVRISVVEGARTVPTKVRFPHGTALEVGAEIPLEGGSGEIVALRARNRTWRRSGDRFRADEVDRAYVRWTARPPAGRSDWTRSRARPRSAASEDSTPARSRSSPGTRVTRSRPRARRAAGGAADQRASPS